MGPAEPQTVDMSRLVSAEEKARLAGCAALLREARGLTASLAESDWYITRCAETGTAVPPEVRAARAVARDRLSVIRDQLRA